MMIHINVESNRRNSVPEEWKRCSGL
jgi:hypothetical protein